MQTWIARASDHTATSVVWIFSSFEAVTLTFEGGRLWVALAEAFGKMHKDPLSLLRLSHEWKSL